MVVPQETVINFANLTRVWELMGYSMEVRRCVFRLRILVVGVFSVVGCAMLVPIFSLRVSRFFSVVIDLFLMFCC